MDKLKDALRSKEYSLLSESDMAAHRTEFNSGKNQIIKDWELETGQEWPKYTESVYSKNGMALRKPGDLYDAHHIIENKFGGIINGGICIRLNFQMKTKEGFTELVHLQENCLNKIK